MSREILEMYPDGAPTVSYDISLANQQFLVHVDPTAFVDFFTSGYGVSERYTKKLNTVITDTGGSMVVPWDGMIGGHYTRGMIMYINPWQNITRTLPPSFDVEDISTRAAIILAHEALHVKEYFSALHGGRFIGPLLRQLSGEPILNKKIQRTSFREKRAQSAERNPILVSMAKKAIWLTEKN